MVIFLQLCIFLIFAVLRGKTLFGTHLSALSPGSDVLTFTIKTRFGRYARHIGLDLAGSIPFIVRREKWYHRFLKGLGIASEIDIGHSSFDDKFFITTDYPGHLEQLLASTDLRKHMQLLFRLRVKSVHTTRQRIWCVIARDDFSKPDKNFERHLERLRSISEDSRASLARERTPPSWRWRGVAALAFIAVQAGLLTLGVLGFFPTLFDSVHIASKSGLVLTGTIAGLFAAALWLCCIVALFKGSSWIAWVLSDFILCGLLGFLLSAILVVRDVNVEMAQASPTLYEQPVVQKSCVLRCKKGGGRRGRRSSYAFDSAAECSPASRSSIIAAKRQSDSRCASRAWFEYKIGIKHWHNTTSYAFTSDEQMFDAVDIGDAIKVPVHPGALRLEWVNWNEFEAKPR